VRGFLICPRCGKLLTGSKSKGHTKYYTYYHCTTGCTCRFNAETVNKEFIYELKKMVPRPEVEILCKNALTEAWNKDTGGRDDRKQLLEEIRDVENRLSNVRDLVATKQIDPADFREMKADFSLRLDKLKAKL
jgi:site-specific DNA recombinase